jgi:prepilin-type N-terminal cleavage/methylation domain-containing protein
MVMKNKVNNGGVGRATGFTLVEVLVAVFLAGIVSIFAMKFYVSEHNNLRIQQNVADMQQNLRASIEEISHRLMNAGANLPDRIQAIQSTDTNPDTLLIRYTEIGGNIRVGDHTQKQQASPIHVEKGSDLSKFSVGQVAYLWHASQQQGEWFTITNISTNNGSGWEEIYHQGQVLLYDPQPGDAILSLWEVKFYIDPSDTAHPVLMRAVNNETPQIYADYVYDLQVEFILTNQDTVSVLTPTDTALVARVSLSAFTGEIDYEATRLGKEGRRQRTLATEVLIRNNLN